VAGFVTDTAIYGAPSSHAPSSFVSIVFGGAYSHSNITVVLGENNTVTWTNNDVVGHTVTADSGLFSSGMLSSKQTWGFTFDHPGTYYYHCSYHAWMHGVVTVIKNS